MSNYLIVLNKDEATVSFIDAKAQQTVKKIDVDINPHEVAISPDKKLSYVTNAGGNTVSVIDNIKMEEIERINHKDFKFPHGVGVSKDGEKLFITATYSDKTFVINTKSFEFEKVIDTYQSKTHMIYFDRNKEKIFIPNIGSNNITVFDVAKEEVIDHFPVGNGPEGAAVDKNNKLLYVANQHDNIVAIYDLEDYSLKKEIKVGTLPIRLVFSPDGKWVYVPNRESGDLSIIDTEIESEVKRIRVGVWPGGTVFNTDGTKAYVANNKTNDISVIDVATHKEIGRIDAGIHPDGIAYLDTTNA
ncbi:MAG: YncE family protein [Clostridia bacterium]